MTRGELGISGDGNGKKPQTGAFSQGDVGTPGSPGSMRWSFSSIGGMVGRESSHPKGAVDSGSKGTGSVELASNANIGVRSRGIEVIRTKSEDGIFVPPDLPRNLTLEDTRFIIDSESIEGINRIGESFKALQHDFPFLEDIGFFGSRVKNTQRPDSDYDVCVYYDGDKFRKARMKVGVDVWDDIVDGLEEGLGAELDPRLRDPDFEVHVDISEAATMYNLTVFMASANAVKDDNLSGKELFLGLETNATFSLMSRFFLTSGRRMHENRQIIFEQLRKQDNGEYYFQTLMNVLSYFERNNTREDKPKVPPYKHYPKTIDEGEDYFANLSIPTVH